MPNAFSLQRKAKAPHARLHRGGTLFLSVIATEILADKDCGLLVEYDEHAATLKLSNPERLPRGIEEADTFPLRVRKGKNQKRPLGLISVKSLLRHIGFAADGNYDFPVAATDRPNRSITLTMPQIQFEDVQPVATRPSMHDRVVA